MDMTNRNPLPTPLRILISALKWALAVFTALLVIAVLVVELMSWNFLKGPITDRVEAMTGREMEITGDISVSLLPRPQMQLGSMQLANADWAQTPDMLTVGSVELEPSIPSLFRGQPALESVTITGPTLTLEGRDGKPGNWALPAMTEAGKSADQEKTAAEDAAADGSGPPVAIRQLQINDGKIRYFAPGAERPQSLSLASLTLAGNSLSLDGEVNLLAAGSRLSLPVELSAVTDPGFADSQWGLSGLQARVAAVRLSGSLSVDTASTPLAITGELHSSSINVTDILAALPESQATESPTVSIPVLPDLNGDIRFTVDQLVLEPTTFTNVRARLRPGQRQLRLEALSFEVGEGRGEASASLVSNAEFVTAHARLDLQQVRVQAFRPDLAPTTVLNAELELGLGRQQQAPSLSVKTLLEHLDIRIARASYRAKNQDPVADTDLDLNLVRAGEPRTPVLSVTGSVQGKALDLTIEGAPLPELAEDPATYRLQVQAQSGELLAWADTQLGALLSPASIAGNVVLQGDGGEDLGTWIGAALPALPRFRIAGQLSRDAELWSVTSLDGQVGVSNLVGEVQYRNTDRPEVNADLKADRIELHQFMAQTSKREPAANRGARPEGAGSPLTALRGFDGQLDLRTDALVIPDMPELANLKLSASLDSGMLRIDPLTFNSAGGRLQSSVTLKASSQPASGTIKVRFRNIALSQLGNTITALEDRLGKLSGELHLGITESLAVDQQEDLVLPFVGRLFFEPSQLTFTEPEAGTDMTFSLRTRGLDDPETDEQTFIIDGEGVYDGSPFALGFRGDPLLAVRDPDRPYSLELTSDVVDSQIKVSGSILRPLALKGLDLALDLEGPNPNRLSRLLGIPLPNLPPYSLSGDLSFRDNRWIFNNIEGKTGGSDLGGQIAMDISSHPPHLTGELYSESVDLEDLGVLAGAERASAEQDGQSGLPQSDGDRFVLPDQALITPAWQDVSAAIRYRGKSVQAAEIPLSNVVIDFALADGRARFEPLRFGVGGGQVDFNLDLNSRLTPPEGTLQVEIRAVDLGQALGTLSFADNSVGIVAGQGKFWVTGDSIANLAGSADGGMVMLMTRGRLDALLVELAGLDAAETFLTWLDGGDSVPIDCAYVDLQARDGVVRIDTLAVDTTDTTFTGTGTVNLGNERLDVTLTAHPKDLSLLSARTPLHLGGTFSDPEPGLQTGNMAVQLASSAVLATVATPIAALLPLLDLGTGAELPYCDGLASRSFESIDTTPVGKDDAENNEN